MRCCSVLLAGLSLAAGGAANVIQARQETTSTSATTSQSSSSTEAPTAGLVQTTINGQATTLEVAVPTGDATETASSASAASPSSTAAPIDGFATGAAGLLSCSKPEGNPICLPANETSLNVGDTYYVTWDATRFDINTTITILLNYANDTSNGNRVAWTSDGTPRERGFVTVKMEDSWRKDTRNATLEFALIAYSPASEHTDRPVDGPTIFLSKTTSHYPPPPENELPDKLGLMIGLPLGLGALFFVMFGLYFGMRKHRKIDVGSVMGRRGRGYDTRKSKRQRLGLKKGAIRLEEREVVDPALDYRDADEIRPVGRRQDEEDWVMPPPGRIPAQRRGTDESLGSLVNDGNENNDRNAFRREIEQQRTGRA